MAARKKAKAKTAARRKATPKRKATARRKGRGAVDMIISKSRTKGAVSKCNVSSEFYAALDEYVRQAIKAAEKRALANKRKTLRPQDL